MITSDMEVITHQLWDELYNFVASTARALNRLFRTCRRSPWFPLLAVAGGAVIALVVIKLIALLAAAFDISFLRDVGNNVGSGGAAGGAAAGAGGAAGGGGDPPIPLPSPPGPPLPFDQGGPPPQSPAYPWLRPHSWWDERLIDFSEGVQHLGTAILGPDGGSSGNAGGKA